MGATRMSTSTHRIRSALASAIIAYSHRNRPKIHIPRYSSKPISSFTLHPFVMVCRLERHAALKPATRLQHRRQRNPLTHPEHLRHVPRNERGGQPEQVRRDGRHDGRHALLKLPDAPVTAAMGVGRLQDFPLAVSHGRRPTTSSARRYVSVQSITSSEPAAIPASSIALAALYGSALLRRNTTEP